MKMQLITKNVYKIPVFFNNIMLNFTDMSERKNNSQVKTFYGFTHIYLYKYIIYIPNSSLLLGYLLVYDIFSA